VLSLEPFAHLKGLNDVNVHTVFGISIQVFTVVSGAISVSPLVFIRIGFHIKIIFTESEMYIR
jgi:hypothetical protein